MFKIHPIVLAAALFGVKNAPTVVSAADCYALYVYGNAYQEGNVVSADVTETKTQTVSCSPGSSGCSSGGIKTVTKEVKARHNFKCVTGYFCGNVGYAPGGLNSGLAWSMDGSECTVSRYRSIGLGVLAPRSPLS